MVVVGAGFLGAEVASTCRGLGLEVTLLDAAPLPLAPLLGERIARCCAGLHAAHGTDVRHGRSVARLRTAPSGRGARVTGVELDDGDGPAGRRRRHRASGSSRTPSGSRAPGCACRTGCTPTPGWSPTCRRWSPSGTSRATPRRRDGTRRHEHWTSAGEQADVAATNLLAGRTTVAFRPSGYFWSDQYGRTLQLAGHPGAADRVEIVDGDPEDRFTARYTDATGTTTAVFGMGSPRAFGRLRRAELGRADSATQPA